jgi:S1-C subfamily serine protease
MTWLDVILIALLAGSLYSGYRRGAVLQVIGIVGLIAGVLVGIAVAPRVAQLARSPASGVAVVLGTVLVAGTIGNVWLLALNLAEGPFPAVSRGLRRSEIVQTLDAALPPPPSLEGEARRLLSLLGYPDVFVGLPEDPSAPVEPPDSDQLRNAIRAARRSTVEVLGAGCNSGFVNQGSGFVVDDDLVVTNAHVVAGTSEQSVQFAGVRTEAFVVGFDPDLDVAVLRAGELDLPSVAVAREEAARGDVGAVLGYPGGGSLTAGSAAVRAVIDPVGRNIYGDGQIERRIYEVQATIRRGNSGGPFVLADGKVAGLVFASAVADERVGYAIVSSEFLPMIENPDALTASVDTGACAG